MSKTKIGVIGGGAAGFFGAVNCAEKNNDAEIVILEKSARILSKVRISGGGRCNVTNALRDAREFILNYPRGGKELLSVFNKFGSAEAVDWFESRGVKLKTEKDGRMFPVTDDSNTIITLFTSLAKKHGIKIVTGFDVNEIERTAGKFIVYDRKRIAYAFDKLLYCPGGFPDASGFNLIRKLGHTIKEPVPSLFSFVCRDSSLRGLSGISASHAVLKIKGVKYSSEGSLLITHNGFSGPAILKLSAFAARELKEREYKFNLEISFVKSANIVDEFKTVNGEKKIVNTHTNEIPSRLWETLVSRSGVSTEKKWRDVSKSDVIKLKEALFRSLFEISGKNTNKEEFVTAGGINLKEVDFRTMESKVCKNLFFAGEVLDIDGITGGFNFQSAWSTAYIASSFL
ncbi:MAG: aminoacetone oxidase family FAD-binding enzyme [Bacteroidetes bacterium]|nr:aminoacetone oxidase family FAD-binding enzyme [Bacteroidota bacterium]